MLAELSSFMRHAIYWLPALVIAMSFHEYAHAKVASMLGDPTPEYHGRLTLNPLKHVDPVGLLMLVIVRFGWAKPVPVNPLYFKGNRRRGMLQVALAGPVTNFVLALVAGLGSAFSLLFMYRGNAFAGHIWLFFEYLLMFNIYLGIFNLLPVPPLDGSKILFNILPPRYTEFLYQIEQYGFLILMLLLLTGLHRVFLIPIADILELAIRFVSELAVLPFFRG
ncbi:MAG: site-2 protease family protein [Bacillota bacterium]